MAKEIIHKDVVIIGAGMAGLTAAMYAGRMNLDVLVLENGIVGGQIANATDIENFPGFISVSGKDLIGTLQKQAENFGAVVDEFDSIVKVSLRENPKIVESYYRQRYEPAETSSARRKKVRQPRRSLLRILRRLHVQRQNHRGHGRRQCGG